MAEFEIKVTELETGGKDYSFPLRAAWLADELRTLGDAAEGLTAPATDGRVDVFAEKTGADVVVHGRVKGAIVAECSRCLGPATVPVDAELSVLLTSRAKNLREPAEIDDLSPEELDREFFTGDVIDLANLVREHLLLEVPMQPLCREDCPGIEVSAAQKKSLAKAGEKPTLDPRLAPLASIQLPAASAAGPSGRKRTKRSSWAFFLSESGVSRGNPGASNHP